MTTKPPTTVVTGTLIQASCETDSANPPAHIIWGNSSNRFQNGDQYNIVSTVKNGLYNAKVSSSSISFNVSRQLLRSSFTFSCGVVGRKLVYWTTVNVKGVNEKAMILMFLNYLVHLSLCVLPIYI